MAWSRPESHSRRVGAGQNYRRRANQSPARVRVTAGAQAGRGLSEGRPCHHRQAGDLNSLCVCWRSHWAKIASPIKIFHIPSEQFQPSERRNCPSSCNFNQQERTGFYTEIIGTWGESDHVFWESIIARQGSVTQMRRQCNNDELWCRGKGYANSEASVATHNFLMNSCSQKGVVHKR